MADRDIYGEILEKYTSKKFGLNAPTNPFASYKPRKDRKDDDSSDSWDEFEREIDEEADRMLNQECNLTPGQFVNFLNSTKGPKMIGAQSRYRISQCILISLCVCLLAVMIFTLLRDNGYYIRCPGSAECDECYGPIFRTSWCPNPNPSGDRRT